MEYQKGRVPLVILLITPSHMKFLDDGDSFMPRLLSKIFPSPKLNTEFDIVAAVVDRIAHPSYNYGVRSEVEHRAGFEGVSVATTYSRLAAPDLWHPGDGEEETGATAALQHPFLTFRFPVEASRVYSATAPKPLLSTMSRDLQIPVANTLFHNGRHGTMFATRWVYLKLQKQYLRIRRMDLGQQTLNLAGIISDHDLRNRAQLVLGLQPITVPRVIAAGLGNIIRELYVGRDSKQTMPASHELEKAMSLHIETVQHQDKRPEVWALITPRENWVEKPQIGTYDAAHWIERGSRLHKIVSGGGGWGMRRGLLALDPEINFNNPRLQTYEPPVCGEVTDIEERQALESIVKPGDVVTFLLSTYSENSQPQDHDKTPTSSELDGSAFSSPSICFGCVPSTMDKSPGPNTVASKVAPLAETIFMKGHFGILSEQGMNLHVEVQVPADSAEQSGTIVRTKIDVPYAYFSITGHGTSHMQVIRNDLTPLRQPEHAERTSPADHSTEDKAHDKAEDTLEKEQSFMARRRDLRLRGKISLHYAAQNEPPAWTRFRILRYNSEQSDRFRNRKPASDVNKRSKARALHGRYRQVDNEVSTNIGKRAAVLRRAEKRKQRKTK
jgi:hypothetical protein